MGWAQQVLDSYELLGRAASDLREENGAPHLITEILQHRIDHLNGHWRWPQPDPDLEFDGEVVQWSWQHHQCSGVQYRYAYAVDPYRCESMVRLSQPEAARHMDGEDVTVYCSWCAHDLAKPRVSGAKV